VNAIASSRLPNARCRGEIRPTVSIDRREGDRYPCVAAGIAANMPKTGEGQVRSAHPPSIRGHHVEDPAASGDRRGLVAVCRHRHGWEAQLRATVYAAKADADHWLDAAGAACATGVQRLVYETGGGPFAAHRPGGGNRNSSAGDDAVGGAFGASRLGRSAHRPRRRARHAGGYHRRRAGAAG
jgi:hypothetical protein